MPVRQSVTFEDPVNNTEAFYQLVEVRPRVIKHKLKVRPQVEGYEVSVGGGYTAPCQPGPLQADLYDEYRSEILTGRRSRTQFLDDYALDCGIVAKRHHRDRYLTPRPVTSNALNTKAITNYEVDSAVLSPPRRYAVGDSTINVSKRTVRTASPPPALSSASPTIPVLAPIKQKGYGREHKTQKSSFSNQVDLIGKRADKITAGSKASLYNVSLADGLEFIRSMLAGGSGYTLADAVRAAKSADIDPYGRKARFNSTMGDGWIGPTENWREKVRKWEQEELSLLEEEQRKRRAAEFHQWEEKMGEAELMESGRAERIKQLQHEWAEAELRFREEAMEAERARQARLNAKSVIIEEIDVGEEAKRIKEQKEAERKAALAKAEAERQAKEQQAAEQAKIKLENERKEREEAEKKKKAEREAALQREAEERKRMEEEELRKKKEEEERIAREKKEEEERIKREEEERLRKEREEAERLKREEEERIRKEEEERLRLEEEERKREEEEVAKKYGMSGFGSFGADPFAVDDDEEEEAEAPADVEETEEDEQHDSSSADQIRGLDASGPENTDEGVELIADDDDGHHDYSYSSHQETIMEEEETGDTADDATEQAQDVYDKSLEDADDSATATLGSLSTAGDKENSWQETEASSGASFQAEINKDGTVTEEESVETLPSTGYSVTGSTKEDSRRLSIVSLEDEDAHGLTNIKDLAVKSSDDSNVRITDYNTETYEHEEEDMKTKGRITTIGGEKEYSTTEEDGSVSTSKATFKASVEEEVSISKSGGEMPSIEVGDADDDDFSSSSYTKTTTSWGGEDGEGEEEEESSTTRRKTTTTTTTVTEETESRRTLKQKASIDTHDHEIIIYNKDGVEITRVTHGDVIVGFDKVDEVVMVKNGLLTVSHETGECLVKIVDGEVNVFEFDGEVIVRSLIDVAHKYLVPKKSERKLSIHDIETRDV